MGVQTEDHATQAVEAADVALFDPGFVEFATAGTPVAGEFRCADCGYGVVVQRSLPQCPMCGGSVWESRGAPASSLAG